MRRIFFLTYVTTLAGCVSVSDPPIASERFNSPYEKIGACIHEHASKESMIGLHFADLRGENRIVIRRTNENIVIWEATINADGPSSSRLEIKAMPTIYGRDYYAAQVAGYARSCL